MLPPRLLRAGAELSGCRHRPPCATLDVVGFRRTTDACDGHLGKIDDNGSDMNISSSAVSLTVEDVVASSRFLVEHFGFHEEMAADGFASLSRPDAGMNVVFLRRGLQPLPADQRDAHAMGVIIAFVVDDLEAELARLQNEGVEITMPLTTEDWGERAFQIRDPNGIIIQLVDWNAAG